MKMQEIVLSTFTKTKNRVRYGSDPFAIYFVYPKGESPCVVKGMSEEVEKYVKERWPVAFYRYCFFKDGESRGGWSFTCEGKFACESGRRIKVSIFHKKKKVREFTLRRMPHHWIPEFDT